MAIHFDGWLRKNYGAHYDVLHVGWLTVYRVAKDGIDLYNLTTSICSSNIRIYKNKLTKNSFG